MTYGQVRIDFHPGQPLAAALFFFIELFVYQEQQRCMATHLNSTTIALLC